MLKDYARRVISKAPFPFLPADVITDLKGIPEFAPPCSEMENLAVDADPLDARCLMNNNLLGKVGTRYLVGSGLGFGLFFELARGRWDHCWHLGKPSFRRYVLLSQVSEFISLCDI